MDKKVWSGLGALIGASLMAIAGIVSGVVGGHAPKSVVVNNDGGSVIVQQHVGFDVNAFCQLDGTVVTKSFFTPPDSTFAANYMLENTVNGVHEVVQVGVYADPSKQPVATHYDADNNPTDGYVSKDALKCIEDHAR